MPRLTETQRRRARNLIATRRGIPADLIDDTVIRQAMDAGIVTAHECGGDGSTGGNYSSSHDSSSSYGGGDC